MLRQRLEKGGRRLSSAQLSPCLDHERARTMGRRERRQSRRRQRQSSPDSKIGEPASTIISSSLSQYRAAMSEKIWNHREDDNETYHYRSRRLVLRTRRRSETSLSSSGEPIFSPRKRIATILRWHYISGSPVDLKLHAYSCFIHFLSTEYVYKNPGVIKLLFETPSGFAIFALDESYLEKDIEVRTTTCFVLSFFLS